MAESTLALTEDELKSEIGYVLGYSRTSGTWSSDQSAHISAMMERGLRQFYYPPTVSIDGRDVDHEWSFLTPVTTLTANAKYTTGTVTVSSGTVTGSSTVFPSWAADGTFIINSKRFSVASRGGDTSLTLDDTSSLADADAGSSYELVHDDLDLPDDFGGILGHITVNDTSEYHSPVRVTSENEIRVQRSRHAVNYTGPPQLAAVRVNSTGPGAEGTRHELLLWPIPDEQYVLHYKYNKLIDLASAGGHFYPGGLPHAETILASCLDVTERSLVDGSGQHREAFLRLLRRSIRRDMKLTQADYHGQNGDESDGPNWPIPRRTYTVTYNGTAYGT